jgi:hypothetical protein
MLADYLEGRLREPHRTRIEAHLASCDHCLGWMAAGHSVLCDPDPPETPPAPEHVTRAAVRLAQDTAAPLAQRVRRRLSDAREHLSGYLAPGSWTSGSLVPVRGERQRVSEDLIRVCRVFEDIDVEIEIERIGAGRATIRVLLAQCGAAEGQDLRVTLSRGHREISSDLLVEGAVVFDDLPFGPYVLGLARNGEDCGVFCFDIKD